MIKTIPIQKVRTNLGDLVNQINYNGSTFVVIRKGKPVMKLTPPDEAGDIKERMKRLMKLAGSLPREDGERMKEIIYRERRNPARGITKL